MNVQVVYCSHHGSDISLREQLAFSNEEQLRDAYVELRSRHPETEIVVLSTCNRVEVYSASENTQTPLSQSEIAGFYSDFHNLPSDRFVDQLLVESGPDAVRHLFRVISSIDSMVLGEPQIVNQVKDAYRIATENDSCGPLTNVLFQRAINVSGRVRSETELAEGRVSIASVAVGEFARSLFTRFDDKSVLIIGAGEMAEETLRYLQHEGVGRIVVVNRSFDRAKAVACEFGGVARAYDELEQALEEADVVVSTTGASDPIVTVDGFKAIRRRNNRKPVFILDLGAPRDFESEISSVDDNVFLYDIDDLEAACDKNRRQRQKETVRAESIIDEETDRFMHDIYHRATGPIVRQLREQWHAISQAELEILFKRLSHLEEKDRKSVEKTIQRIVNKLLHPPLETLKDEAKAGTPHGLLDAVRRLFQISE